MLLPGRLLLPSAAAAQLGARQQHLSLGGSAARTAVSSRQGRREVLLCAKKRATGVLLLARLADAMQLQLLLHKQLGQLQSEVGFQPWSPPCQP